jgi:hypothetical protein
VCDKAQKAVGLIVTHPLGISALEFHERYHHEDVHEVYLSMFLNAGWLGGTLYFAVVLLTIGLGLRQVVRDRGGDGVSAVLAATFIGMATEGLVIDSDHWRWPWSGASPWQGPTWFPATPTRLRQTPADPSHSARGNSRSGLPSHGWNRKWDIGVCMPAEESSACPPSPERG